MATACCLLWTSSCAFEGYLLLSYKNSYVSVKSNFVYCSLFFDAFDQQHGGGRRMEGEANTSTCNFLDLPNEVLVHIFSFTTPSALLACERVCHYFHDSASSEHAWKVRSSLLSCLPFSFNAACVSWFISNTLEGRERKKEARRTRMSMVFTHGGNTVSAQREPSRRHQRQRR